MLTVGAMLTRAPTDFDSSEVVIARVGMCRCGVVIQSSGHSTPRFNFEALLGFFASNKSNYGAKTCERDSPKTAQITRLACHLQSHRGRKVAHPLSQLCSGIDKFVVRLGISNASTELFACFASSGRCHSGAFDARGRNRRASRRLKSNGRAAAIHVRQPEGLRPRPGLEGVSDSDGDAARTDRTSDLGSDATDSLQGSARAVGQ